MNSIEASHGQSNGNGLDRSKREGYRKTIAKDVHVGKVKLPAWMDSIQEALANSIDPTSLKKIMDVQVQAAMDGDLPAAKFVFEQAAKLSTPKEIQIVQNNYFSETAELPTSPTAHLPGSEAKIDLMRRRVESGEEPTRPDDAGGDGEEVDLS